MRFHCLRLQNFKGYKDSTIEFDPNFLYLFEGKNGAGKSTVFHAINFGLFKEIHSTHRSDEVTLYDLVRYGETEAKITLELTTSQRFEIERTITLNKKGGSCSTKLKIEVNGKLQPYDNRQGGEIDEKIEELLGFNKIIWFNTMMRCQKETCDFLTTTDSKRMEMMTKIFDFQYISENVKVMDEKLKNVESIIQRLSMSIKEYQSHLINVEFAESNLVLWKEEIEDIEKEMKVLLSKEIADEKIKQFHLKNDRFFELKQEWRNKTDAIDRAFQKELKEYDRKMERKNALQDEFDKKNAQAKRPEVIEIDENIKEQKTELMQYSDKAKKIIQTTKEEIATLKERLEVSKYASNSVCPLLKESCDRISHIGDLTQEVKQYITIKNSVVEKETKTINDNDKQIKSIEVNLRKIDEYNNQMRDYEIRRNSLKEFADFHRTEINELRALPLPKKEDVIKKIYIEDPQLEELKQRIKNAELERDQYSKEIEGCDPELHERLEKKKEELKEDILKTTWKISQHYHFESLIIDLDHRRKRADYLAGMYRHAKKTFGKDGFLQDHINNLMPLLEEKMNDYLQVFEDGRFQINIGEKITVNDGLNGKEVKLHQISGGQENFLKFCYLQAITYLKFNEANVTSISCLDEPFEGLDKANLNTALSVILRLFNELNLTNCFVVTHKHFDSHPSRIKTLNMVNDHGISKTV